MKKKLLLALSLLMVAVLVLTGCPTPATTPMTSTTPTTPTTPAAIGVTLEVLNPRGEITAVEMKGLSNPRLTDLNGKRIGFFWNAKPDGDVYWNRVAELIKQKYPTSQPFMVTRAATPSFVLPEEVTEVEAKQVDVFVYGVGD